LLGTTILMNQQNRTKRVLFDLNHPADFHFFKHLMNHLLNQDYTLCVVARDKECLHLLLDDAGIPYQSRGTGKHTLLGKYLYAMIILLRLFSIMLRFRPGVTMSLSSPYLALLSRFLRIPCITYDDTDLNPRLLPLIRLSKFVFSPSSYPHHFHPGHFHLPAFKELAYLHPSLFQMKKERDGAFFRVTRTDSVHHSRESHLDLDLLMNKIHQLNSKMGLILSSEIPADQNLHHAIRSASPTQIHRELAGCRVFWGNSATMAAEAAVLGIPAVFVGSEKFAYIKELEDIGLLFHYVPENLEDSLNKLDSLLAGDPPQDDFTERKSQLLQEKLNLTPFMAWFVEQLPGSARILKEQPDFVLQFMGKQGK